jgi:hypothetical protein
MKNENKEKSLLERLTGKKEKKKSCCCNFEVEEIPEDKYAEKCKNESNKCKGDCCK